jgi:coenzyme F420-reducing hydrogenase gamma subunit
MSATVWAVVVSAITCLIVLAVLIKGLVERLKRLTASLSTMQEQVRPLADVIITEGAVAQQRLEEINRATARIREGALRYGVAAPNGGRSDSPAEPEPTA